MQEEVNQTSKRENSNLTENKRLSERNVKMEEQSVCLEKVQRERDLFAKSAAI